MHDHGHTRSARGGDRPLVMVPHGDGADGVLADVRARLRASGWEVLSGLGTRPAGRRTVLEGRVTCDEDAASAVLAAIDGYGLLVLVTLEGPSLHRLEDDLRRLGVLHVADPEQGGTSPAPAPDPDGLAILAMLARGHTLGEAADALGISRRTADRRLSAAKRALGAGRTTEAIAVAAKHGMLDGRRQD